jgi:G:T/U-mismatch repair DNA glycosylase
VLGTFPTLNKNWRFNAYYPGRSNFFWRMLSEIYHHPFQNLAGEEAANERLALCAAKGIALSDTVYSCTRKAVTSKDSDLIVVEKMDILGLLKQHPSLQTIILTGSSGQVSAHKLFYEHLHENAIAFTVELSKPPITGSFNLGNRHIKTHSLYSTSGINIGRYQQAVEQYRKVLPD